MTDDPGRQVHVVVPHLDPRGLAVVTLGLRTALAAALVEFAAVAGPARALELKQRLVEEAKNTAPSGLPPKNEVAAIEALVLLIDTTIGPEDRR